MLVSPNERQKGSQLTQKGLNASVEAWTKNISEYLRVPQKLLKGKILLYLKLS